MMNQKGKLAEIVSLPKDEYLRLKQEAGAYRFMATKIHELPLKDPVKDLMADFKSTNLYTDDFLADMEEGLRKSSYAKKYAHQTS